MLGFGKKKKKDKEEAKASKKDLPDEKEDSKDQTDSQDDPGKVGSGKNKSEKKKKKLLSKKKIIIVLLVLIAVGASSYVVYTQYFTSKNANSQNATYEKLELKHIHLPEEMIRFCFDYFPDLYVALIVFNSEMNLFDQEIARIDAIAQKYPDQKKIADKEKKTWVKAKNTLQKAFLKIEKPVKATYVLFRVNKNQGLTQIEEKTKELTELAQSALIPAKELTQKLKSKNSVTKGLIKGTIYKLKKKFL
jgi:hypothetical protein